MSDTIKRSEIIRNIYNTVNKPNEWQEVLKSISQDHDSTHAFFTARKGFDGEPIGFFEHGFDNEYFLNYGAHFFEVDVWTKNLAKFTPNQFHPSHKVYKDKLFLQSEIYNDFAKPVGIRHSIGCFFGDPSSDIAIELAFMRSKGQAHYEDERIKEINKFLPHIQHSLELGLQFSQLRSDNTNLLSTFDSLEEGVIVCTKDKKIEYCNSMASSILSQSGLFRSHIHERLSWKSSHHEQRFEEMIQDSIRSLAGDYSNKPVHQLFNVFRREQCFLVKMKPWTRSQKTIWGEQSNPGVIIFIRPANSERVAQGSEIAEIFSLTLAEGEVSRSLCQGDSLEQMAEERGVALSTIRQQVKSCLGKASCKNQAELVSKILTRTLI